MRAIELRFDGKHLLIGRRSCKERRSALVISRVGGRGRRRSRVAVSGSWQTWCRLIPERCFDDSICGSSLLIWLGMDHRITFRGGLWDFDSQSLHQHLNDDVGRRKDSEGRPRIVWCLLQVANDELPFLGFGRDQRKHVGWGDSHGGPQDEGEVAELGLLLSI